MAGAVPLNDLPDSLRGRSVPAEDLPSAAPRKAAPKPQEFTYDPESGAKIPAADLATRTDAAGAGAEIIGKGLLNIPGQVAGFGAKLLGQIAENVNPNIDPAAWRAKMQGPLTADLSPNAQKHLAPLVQPMAQAWGDNVEPFLNRHPAVGALVDTAGTALEGAGIAAGARSGAGLLGDVMRAKPPRVPLPGDPTHLSTPAAEVSRAGINVTPGEVERQVAGSGEKIAGSRRAQFGTGAANRENAMGNAPRVNQIALEGMPESVKLDPRNSRLEQSTLDAAKKIEGAKYDAVRAVPGEGASPELVRSLDNIAAGLGDVTEDAAAKIQRVLTQKAAGGNSNKLVADIMDLRQEAVMDGKRAFNQNDPDARVLARAKRQVADQLEEELARRGEAAGLQGVRDTLKEARTNFAKIATLEEATDQGFVDAARLEKVAEGGGYLSGGLAKLSEFNKAAPVSLTHPQRIAASSEPGLRAGASPQDMALRSAQFLGGNLVTKRIGRSGINAVNEKLRGFLSPEAPPPPEVPPFSFERPPPPPTPWAPNEGPQNLALAPDPPPGFFSGSPRIQQGANLAESPGFSLEGQPPGATPLQQFEGSLLPWETPNNVPPLQGPRNGDFASQLGIPARGLDVPAPQGMPDTPHGVAGPFSAQLSDPRLPNGLQLMDEPPLPPRAQFGPADEFTGPDAGGPFSDRYQVPGTQRLETPQGYITYRDMGDRWQVNDAYTLPQERGKGFGQQQLLELSQKAQAAGKRLDSDIKVSADQRRVYEKLKARGLLDYDESPNGGPVFRNIRPTGGVSDLLGQ